MPDNEKHLARRGGFRSGRGLARLLIAGVLCLHTLFFIDLWPRIKRGYPDFVVYYTAATILRDGLGHQLYVSQVQAEVQKRLTGQLPERLAPLPYIHPPAEALIFVPLTQLPFLQAFLLWDLLNIAVLFGVAWLLRSDVSWLRSVSPWEFVLGSLAFFPVFETLLQGQDSVLQLLFCVLAWKALNKKSDVVAGCWLALGAFKFQFMLPIVFLIFIWKRRRVVIGFAAVSVVVALISVRLVGWRGLLRYPAFALQIANTPSWGGVPPDFLPNLHGLVMGWPLHLSGAVGTGVVILISAGLVLFAVARGRKWQGPGNNAPLLLLAIAVSELVGWQTNVHDFSLLVLSLVLIADYCLRTPQPRPGRRFALLYPALPILISPLWLVLWLSAGHLNLMAIPLVWWVWEIGQELSRHQDVSLSPAYAVESAAR